MLIKHTQLSYDNVIVDNHAPYRKSELAATSAFRPVAMNECTTV
jgi:hypothetical protein